MPVVSSSVAYFNRTVTPGGATGLLAAGADANLGIRHGTMSTQSAYETESAKLDPGFRPRAYADYLDYNAGPFLPNSQAQAYLTPSSSSRAWVKNYADSLPGSDRLKLAINMGGVTTTGSDSTTVADVLASNPATTNSARWLLLDSLDSLQQLQNDHKVTVVCTFMHEPNGGWYPWGWDKATHADFIALWQWWADEAHARGLLVAWALSIGPVLSGGLETGSDPNVQRWPGSDYVDVVVLNHYDKLESNRNTTTLLNMLIEMRTFALTEGCAFGLGEWGSGGHSSVEHLANTYGYLDTLDAGFGPGECAYEVRWNPSSGGPSNSGGGSNQAYYDFTRTAGPAAFPARAAFESDLHSWVVGGKVGPAPYADISPYLALEP